MPNQPIYYCNGKYVPAHQAVISVRDLGLVRGFGLFESLRTYEGKPFLLKAHLDRLYRAAKKIGLKPPVSQASANRIVHDLLRKNHLKEALLRFVLTGGPSSSLLPQGVPSLIILVDPFHPFPSWQYEKGIRLMTAPFGRIYPALKSTIYFSAVLETMRAVRSGCHEAVYVDREGSILEGTTYSVFAVLPGPRLVTPKEGILPSITAECVLSLARKLKISVQRSPIRPSIQRQAREMFIASSNRELIPVVRIDQQRIGKGSPGPITHLLHQAYKRLTPS